MSWLSLFATSASMIAGRQAKPPPAAGSMADFTRFHGMHCGIQTAQRCVSSFNGVIIFSPSSYTMDSTSSFPMDSTSSFPNAEDVSPFEVRRKLTVARYYLLVLCTLTGLSTLIGLTKTIDASEGSAAQAVTHPLHPDAQMLKYLERRAGAPVRLVRRFEFRFRLVGLHVVMLHYLSDSDGRLHLVEVYEAGGALRLAAPWFLLFGVSLAVGLLAGSYPGVGDKP